MTGNVVLSHDVAGQLASAIRRLGKVAIAFSGGVDSALLLHEALTVLGATRVVALTAVGPQVSRADLDFSRSTAKALGATLVEVPFSVLEVAKAVSNQEDRCYFCKLALMARLLDRAGMLGFSILCDGTNASDSPDERPGMRALAELNILSPLRLVGVTRRQVRALAGERRLPQAGTPSNSCLATRFPKGRPITASGMARVERAEDNLKSLGLLCVRVRNCGHTARIEVDSETMARLVDDAFCDALKRAVCEAGFEQMVVNPECRTWE